MLSMAGPKKYEKDGDQGQRRKNISIRDECFEKDI